MSGRADREGLSFWYLVWYRIQYVVWHIMGPAQLGEADDPHVRLRRQREARVEAARTARRARESHGRA